MASYRRVTVDTYSHVLPELVRNDLIREAMLLLLARRGPYC